MAKTYTVQDSATGKTITFQWGGAKPPTEEDMAHVVTQSGASAPEPDGYLPVTADAPGERPSAAELMDKSERKWTPQDLKEAIHETNVPEWGRNNPNWYGAYGAAKALGRTGIETAGQVAGGALGALSPLPGGALLGAGTGYAAAKQLADFALGDDEWKPPTFGDVAKDATIGAVTEGVGAAIPKIPAVYNGVKDFAASVPERAATKLYDMTLKQGTTLKPSIRANNVETGLSGGYLPTSKGVDKLAKDIALTEQRLASGISAGDAADVSGTLDRATNNVAALRDQANRAADPDRANALIDAELDRLRSHPLQQGPGNDIPVGELQKMKVEQGRHVKYQQKNGQAVDPFQTSIDKARIRGIKEELEDKLSTVFPELKDTNRKLGSMYQLQDVLERAANRIENNQGIGIGLPIKGGAGATIGGMVGGPGGAALGGGIGAMIGIIEHPSVAPRLAMMLYKSSKGAISRAQANAIVQSRLSTLTKYLTKTAVSTAVYGALNSDPLGIRGDRQ